MKFFDALLSFQWKGALSWDLGQVWQNFDCRYSFRTATALLVLFLFLWGCCWFEMFISDLHLLIVLRVVSEDDTVGCI